MMNLLRASVRPVLTYIANILFFVCILLNINTDELFKIVMLMDLFWFGERTFIRIKKHDES